MKGHLAPPAACSHSWGPCPESAGAGRLLLKTFPKDRPITPGTNLFCYLPVFTAISPHLLLFAFLLFSSSRNGERLTVLLVTTRRVAGGRLDITAQPVAAVRPVLPALLPSGRARIFPRGSPRHAENALQTAQTPLAPNPWARKGPEKEFCPLVLQMRRRRLPCRGEYTVDCVAGQCWNPGAVWGFTLSLFAPRRLTCHLQLTALPCWLQHLTCHLQLTALPCWLRSQVQFSRTPRSLPDLSCRSAVCI